MQLPELHLFEEQAALKNTILLTTVHYATKHFIKNENERREKNLLRCKKADDMGTHSVVIFLTLMHQRTLNLQKNISQRN